MQRLTWTDFQASWCNDYQQHAVEMFYELSDLSSASSNSSDPCRQFTITPVQGTSVFLLGLPSRNVHNCLDSAVTSNEVCADNLCLGLELSIGSQ